MSTIPSSPEDRKAILIAVQQISESLCEISTAHVQINEILKALSTKYKLPAKTFRKVAFMYHRQNVNEFENETAEIKEVYKSVTSV
jgi:hypothetical protein